MGFSAACWSLLSEHYSTVTYAAAMWRRSGRIGEQPSFCSAPLIGSQRLAMRAAYSRTTELQEKRATRLLHAARLR